jgi:hypothetical protein
MQNAEAHPQSKVTAKLGWVLGVLMSVARFPLGRMPWSILQPTALAAVVNGKPQQPRRAAPKVRGLRNMSCERFKCDTLNGDADPEPLLTAKRTAETC